ncbi:MAG: MFS transporter [Rikenellaceae bacterium]|nr:MFS transporter [Rikenellaceae bacterium]
MKENWKRTFAIIWSGQLFSTLSSSVVGFAVIFWLSIQTGSAEILALSTIATLLPQLLLGLFTGVYVDRWDRRKTMICADLFVALNSGLLAALFFFSEGQADILLIYLLLALRSVGSAFHIPAMQASTPLLAPESQLMKIAGINQVIFSLSTIAGPAIAAVFVASMNMTFVLLMDVAGALLATISLLLVKIPNPAKSAELVPHLKREIKEGFHALLQNKTILWLFLFIVFATFFIMPVATMFPLLTLDHFLGDAYRMSLIEIVWGVGMLAGGAIMSIKVMGNINKIVLINTMYIILGITFALSGMLPQEGYWFFAALTIIGGVSAAIFHGSFMVVMQTSLDPAVMGRAFSIFDTFSMLPALVGLLLTGYIADNIGITNTFVISGSAIIIIGILSFLTPALNKFRNFKQ